MSRTGRTRILCAVWILLLSTATPALAARDPGLTSADGCATDDLVAELAPADVQGTTFVGTYLGETTVGREMDVFWQVHRVFAGGPLPQRLFYGTPPCEWANLTPGVRYLFSTSATNLDPASDSADQPGVANSMAWEIYGDGAVRLAPFDTWAVTDYRSEELSGIASLDDALQAVAPGAGKGERPAIQDADFGCPPGLQRTGLEDGRGYTFVGIYIGDERLASDGIDNTRVVWSVERVYAGGPLPELLALRTDACRPTTLRPGRRYLFTTADILTPSQSNSLAWRLRSGGRVTLATFGDDDLDAYKADARAVRSLEAALESLGLDAADSQIPLRAPDRTPG